MEVHVTRLKTSRQFSELTNETDIKKKLHFILYKCPGINVFWLSLIVALKDDATFQIFCPSLATTTPVWSLLHLIWYFVPFLKNMKKSIKAKNWNL